MKKLFLFLSIWVATIALAGFDYVTNTGQRSTTGDYFSAVDVTNYKTLQIQVQSLSGTILFKGSNDGVTYVTVDAILIGTGTVTSATADGLYVIPVNFKYFKINLSSVSSGTSSVIMRAIAAETPMTSQMYATGGGGSNTVSDTSSIDLTLLADDISGVVKLSSASAGAGSFNSALNLETDGLHAQVSNESVQDAVGGILTDTNSVDVTYNDGSNTIANDLRISSNAADAANVKVTNDIQSTSSVGLRSQLSISSLLTALGITQANVDSLINNEALTTVSLSDNQSSAANVATWTVATFNSIVIDYSIKRVSSGYETGQVSIVSDGSSCGISQTFAAISLTGITFTCDINSGSLRWRYTSTDATNGATLKYKLQKWLN